MNVHTELQVSENGSGGFEMVVTLVTDKSYWTSRPARLEARNWSQAVDEATAQVRQLRAALGVES